MRCGDGDRKLKTQVQYFLSLASKLAIDRSPRERALGSSSKSASRLVPFPAFRALSETAVAQSAVEGVPAARREAHLLITGERHMTAMLDLPLVCSDHR